MNARASSQPKTSGPLERAAWIAMLVTVAATPLAVGKLGFFDTPLTYTAFAFPQTVTLLVGVSITLLLWGLAVARGHASVYVSKWLLPVGVLTALAIVATIAAPEPARAFLGKSTSGLALVNVLGYAALFFLATQLVSGSRRLHTLTSTIVYSATAVAGIALLQQLFGADVFGLPQLEAWMTGRGFSTLGNPDHLGTFLVLPAVLALGLAQAEDDLPKRMFAMACSVVLATALAGTLTRGAWVGFAFGIVALLAFALRGHAERRRLVLIGLVLLAAIAIALVASDSGDLRSRFTAAVPETAAEGPGGIANVILSDRLSLWRDSLAIAAERPLTGIGPASFELGWYGVVEKPVSTGGQIATADDPHSLVMFVVATMGFPAALVLCVAIAAALGLGTRTSLQVRREGAARSSVVYSAWLSAAVGLQVSLLAAAVTTPLVASAFLSMAVLLRPQMRTANPPSRVLSFAYPLAASIVALVLTAALTPSLRAEGALAASLKPGGSLAEAREAVVGARHNMDVQRAYYFLRLDELDRALAGQAAGTFIQELDADLAAAGRDQGLELYYPALRTQVLTRASEVLGPEPYATQAVAAADAALKIMPQYLPARVNKALALSDLGRYEEMAETLEGHWQNEVSSAYPGILYAQALALSGRTAESKEIFARLESRFPGDPSIGSARQQVEDLTTP